MRWEEESGKCQQNSKKNTIRQTRHETRKFRMQVWYASSRHALYSHGIVVDVNEMKFEEIFFDFVSKGLSISSGFSVHIDFELMLASRGSQKSRKFSKHFHFSDQTTSSTWRRVKSNKSEETARKIKMKKVQRTNILGDFLLFSVLRALFAFPRHASLSKTEF